jgi:uncharacterized membrane protein HdeD (DUF308 family)
MIEQQVLTNWWGLTLRGLAAIAFGMAVMAVPGLTLAVLVVTFGVWAILEGIFAIVSGFRARAGQPRWWVLLVQGIISIGAGILAFAWPGATLLAFVVIVAIRAIMVGGLEIASAIHLRKQIRGEWLLGLAGVLSIVLGVFLLGSPGLGVVALVYWIGIYALVVGALLVIQGGRVLSRTRGDIGRPAAV